MAYKGLNDNKVTAQLDLSVGTIGKSRKEGRDLSGKVIEQILNFYTDLSRVWLLTGEGEMLNKSVNVSHNCAGHITQSAGVGHGTRTLTAHTTNHFGSAIVTNELEKLKGLYERALDEISAQRELTAKAQEQVSKAQEQIDRLLAIIERQA